MQLLMNMDASRAGFDAYSGTAAVNFPSYVMFVQISLNGDGDIRLDSARTSRSVKVKGGAIDRERNVSRTCAHFPGRGGLAGDVNVARPVSAFNPP